MPQSGKPDLGDKPGDDEGEVERMHCAKEHHILYVRVKRSHMGKGSAGRKWLGRSPAVDLPDSF
jgi:hypothetical protein